MMNESSTDIEGELRRLAAQIEPDAAFVSHLEMRLVQSQRHTPTAWARLVAAIRGNEPMPMLDDDGFVVQQVPPQRPMPTVIERRFAIGALALVGLIIVGGALLASLASVRRVDVPQSAITGVPTMQMIIKPIWQQKQDLAVFGDVVALESFTHTAVVTGQPISLTLNLRALNGPFDQYALTLKVSRNDVPLLASPIGPLAQLAGGRALSAGQRFSVTVPIDVWDTMRGPADTHTLALSVETVGTLAKRAAVPVVYPVGANGPRYEAVLTTLNLADDLSRTACVFDESDSATKPLALMWPTQGSITQGFWYGHKGIDIANVTGTPVRAAGDGVVSFAGWSEVGYGYMVVIDPMTGTLRTNMQTLYAHLSSWHVDLGQTVKAGQVIGAVGSTGNVTEPHLHFEVQVKGVPCNPMPWLPGAAPNDRLVWYTVQAGDTVSGIAARYGIAEIELMRLNPKLNPDNIQVGELLAVQMKTATK